MLSLLIYQHLRSYLQQEINNFQSPIQRQIYGHY